jgi:predicted metalloenzyme YecM
MRRGYIILIAGAILLVASIGIGLPSIYLMYSLAESMPTNITTKDVIHFALNMNQTAIKESLRSIGIDVGLAFFGILVSVTLMVNGIIALIAGTVIVILDKRRSRHNTIPK